MDMATGRLAASEATVDETAIQALRAAARGAVVGPGDEGYDASRKVFNAMIDKRPSLIVRCAGPADVIQGVTFARTHDLPLAVRGGGHSVAGKAVCDGGLMLDLSPMKGIRVDPVRRTADAQPGLLLRDLDHETQAFGLATPLGIVSVTGIAGLTLGGGIGWLNGKHGLACDNVLSADVVTADGQLLTASSTQEEDLYWGIRGGSGNFGVVTSFTYRLHPVGPVLGGPLLYPFTQAREVLRLYHEFASTCPDELSTAAVFAADPDGNPVVAIVACYCGAIETGEQVLRPLRGFGTPLADLIQPMAYGAMQRMFDADFPAGRQHYWRAGWLTDLSDDAIEVLLRFVAEKPSPATPVGLQQVHGAASRVDPTATAFPHRDQQYELLILSQWADPADSAKNVEWTRAFFEAMQPFLGRGVYVNDLGEEGEDRVKAAYGTNYERLVAVKNKYDPTNFFRVNHNIKPTARG
jgi:FAD/FMN-containing dehydrogenase